MFAPIGAACLWIHDNLEPAFLNGRPHNAIWTLGLILAWMLACSFVVMRANALWERRHLSDH